MFEGKGIAGKEGGVGSRYDTGKSSQGVSGRRERVEEGLNSSREGLDRGHDLPSQLARTSSASR